MHLTLNQTIDALNAQGNDFFDLFSPDPFADLYDAEAEELAATVCPYHGPHEVDEDGVSLSYCERCEGSL